jgi:hypothetical protein
MSFQWAKKEREERENELVQTHPPEEDRREETPPPSESDDRTADEGSGIESQPDPELSIGNDVAEEANRKIDEIEREEIEPILDESLKPLRLQLIPELEKELAKKDPLAEWNEMIAEAEKAAEQEKEVDDQKLIDDELSDEIKEAMTKWKQDNPNDSLKHQRYLHNKGIIDKLPWETYLKAEPDFQDNEAAEEAAKWAMEQLEESKKKDSDLDGDSAGTADQKNEIRIEGYVQNAEQNDSTIWQRVKKSKSDE